VIVQGIVRPVDTLGPNAPSAGHLQPVDLGEARAGNGLGEEESIATDISLLISVHNIRHWQEPCHGRVEVITVLSGSQCSQPTLSDSTQFAHRPTSALKSGFRDVSHLRFLSASVLWLQVALFALATVYVIWVFIRVRLQVAASSIGVLNLSNCVD
jgi:hypothetical protein